MYIYKFYIENFKLFKNTSIYFDESLNILTGANNSGKTSILEAISLWETCFYKLLNQTDRDIYENKKLKISAGDYKLGYVKKSGDASTTYVAGKEIISVRTSVPGDIHHFGLPSINTILLEATLKEGQKQITIAFEVIATTGGIYQISFRDAKNFDYVEFNKFFKNFPKPINIIYASPVASVQSAEEFETMPKIKQKINARESVMVIRNRLYNLFNDRRGLWNNFLDDLSYILNNKSEIIDIILEGNLNKDVQTCIKIKTTNRGFSTDISLVGSGTLQIIEILLATYEEKADINIILLDEPDSHIHRDIQKRLLKLLIDSSKNNQIFITTHNESLIRGTRPQHLFHLEGSKKNEYRPIINEKIEGIERGLQPSYQIKILQSLGSESSLDLLNALEADALVFVEGKEDAIYIQKILNNKYNNFKFLNVMYWAFEGIDNMLSEIKYYKRIFESIKNNKSLWEKSVLIFDKDFLTKKQREDFIQELKISLKIDVYIWKSYTMESSILQDIPQFTLLLQLYSERKLNKNLDYNALFVAVQEQVNILAENLKIEIQKFENSGALGNEIMRKRDAIQGRKGLPKKDKEGVIQVNIFGNKPDTALAPNYREEILQDLNVFNITTYSRKKDVDKLIRSIYDSFNLEIGDTFDVYFPQLLDLAVSPRLWFAEWDEVIKIIEEKTNII